MRPTTHIGLWFRPAIFLTLLALLWVLAACSAPTANDQTPVALSRVYTALHNGTASLTRQLAQAAHGVNARDPAGDPTNAALQALCDIIPQATRCMLLDGSRVFLAARPLNQRAYIGTVDHVWPGIQSGEATQLVCSQVYRAANSDAAVDAGTALPGTLAPAAAVVATIHLGDWLATQIGPAITGMPFEVWVMQPDGLILYDANPEEIGRNLFADPLYRNYPELLKLGQAIAADTEGGGAYTFLRKDMQEPVKKVAFWTTYDFCGQPWRIVLAHAVQGHDDGSVLVADPGPAAAQEALRTLAQDPVLIDALAVGDQAWGRTVFRALYDAYPSIYAVQFIDADGVNQFGFPPENSLVGYDFRTLQSERDDLFLAALQREHETTFDLPLLEGPIGQFFLTPVYEKGKFLGMVYLIQVRG